jgi:hypothetical protein
MVLKHIQISGFDVCCDLHLEGNFRFAWQATRYTMRNSNSPPSAYTEALQMLLKGQLKDGGIIPGVKLGTWKTIVSFWVKRNT